MFKNRSLKNLIKSSSKSIFVFDVLVINLLFEFHTTLINNSKALEHCKTDVQGHRALLGISGKQEIEVRCRKTLVFCSKMRLRCETYCGAKSVTTPNDIFFSQKFCIILIVLQQLEAKNLLLKRHPLHNYVKRFLLPLKLKPSRRDTIVT